MASADSENEKSHRKAPPRPVSVAREIVRNTGRLGRLVWREDRGKICLIAVLHVLSSIFPFVQSGVWALFINELVRQAGSGVFDSALLQIAVIALVLQVLPSFFTIYQRFELILFEYKVEELLEMMLRRAMANIDLPTYENPKFNDLLSSVREQSTWKARTFIQRNYFLIQDCLQLLIAATILLYASWWLALVVIACTLPSLWVEATYGRMVWTIWDSDAPIRRRYQDLNWRFSLPNSVVELRLFQNTRHFLKMCSDLFLKYRANQRTYEAYRMKWQIAANAVSQTAYLLACVYFCGVVIRGDIQIGTFNFLLVAVSSFSQATSTLFMNLGKHYSDSLFVTDCFRVIDLPKQIKSAPNPVAITSREIPEIVFDEVSFKYPGSDAYALRNVSVRIAPNERLGLVGKNGAGKSTFIKLLCRLYDCTEGKITIDGVDIRELDMASWYERLGVLTQGYESYYFPVKEVIHLGDTFSELDIERVKQAAVFTEADDFIRRWPDQYDQMLGKQFEGGEEPSWGQWQKLALARVLYRNPHVLILDEPTASMDAEAEAKIFDRLRGMEGQHTMLLISHRFSTLRNSDRILVFSEGRIIERGSHRDLLEQNGVYSDLFNLQARGYVTR